MSRRGAGGGSTYSRLAVSPISLTSFDISVEKMWCSVSLSTTKVSGSCGLRLQRKWEKKCWTSLSVQFQFIHRKMAFPASVAAVLLDDATVQFQAFLSIFIK
ncbi:hypothetical protein Hanom_Chr12g01098231 [Helianthus anomalus]